MSIPLEKIIKKYPKKGPLSQFRFEKVISYACFRCKSVKTSKLISICNDEWDFKLCNGCYGRLISLYEIHRGQKSNEDKIEQINETITDIQKQFSESLDILIKNYSNKNTHLDNLTNKYLATANLLYEKLPKREYIEWSPAILCLCKSVENELINKIISPLKKIASETINENPSEDKRTIKIEKYIYGKSNIPPELGAISFLFELLSNSEKWKQNNPIFNLIKSYCQKRPFSDWIYSKNGAAKSLNELCQKYRNIAAHISDLKIEDYEKCLSLVCAKNGILDKICTTSSKVK